MIDRPKQVAELMQKLKMHLPIPVKATDMLIRTWQDNSSNIPPNAHIEIADVLYMGDEGGICCALKIAGNEDAEHLVSLTHLRLYSSDPLSPAVLAYQTSRIKKLSKRR